MITITISDDDLENHKNFLIKMRKIFSQNTFVPEQIVSKFLFGDVAIKFEERNLVEIEKIAKIVSKTLCIKLHQVYDSLCFYHVFLMFDVTIECRKKFKNTTLFIQGFNKTLPILFSKNRTIQIINDAIHIEYTLQMAVEQYTLVLFADEKIKQLGCICIEIWPVHSPGFTTILNKEKIALLIQNNIITVNDLCECWEKPIYNIGNNKFYSYSEDQIKIIRK